MPTELPTVLEQLDQMHKLIEELKAELARIKEAVNNHYKEVFE